MDALRGLAALKGAGKAMGELQAKLALIRVTGTAGGVKATFTGLGRCEHIAVPAGAVDGALVAAAVNDALAKVAQEAMREQMAAMAGMMGGGAGEGGGGGGMFGKLAGALGGGGSKPQLK